MRNDDISIITNYDDERFKALVQLAKRYYKIPLYQKVLKWFSYPQEREELICWFTPGPMVDTRCLICGSIFDCFKPEKFGSLLGAGDRQLIQHGINHLKQHNLLALL